LIYIRRRQKQRILGESLEVAGPGMERNKRHRIIFHARNIYMSIERETCQRLFQE